MELSIYQNNININNIKININFYYTGTYIYFNVIISCISYLNTYFILY